MTKLLFCHVPSPALTERKADSPSSEGINKRQRGRRGSKRRVGKFRQINPVGCLTRINNSSTLQGEREREREICAEVHFTDKMDWKRLLIVEPGCAKQACMKYGQVCCVCVFFFFLARDDGRTRITTMKFTKLSSQILKPCAKSKTLPCPALG